MPIDFNKLTDSVIEKIKKRIESMSAEEREELIKRQKEKNNVTQSALTNDHSENNCNTEKEI